jgi:hypothetical protein
MKRNILCSFTLFALLIQPTNLLNFRFNASLGAVPTAVLWDYDFTKPQNKACSTATQASCVISFTLSTTNVSNPNVPPVPVGTASTLSVLAMPPSNPSGPTVGISMPYTAPTAFGWYMVSVQVNFNDAGGVAQSGPKVGLSYYVGPDTIYNLRTTP